MKMISNSSTDKSLTINEIFYTIQGESYLSGLPTVFIRLTGCHQRCTYCDTEYAFYEGTKMTIEAILEKIKDYPCKNVLVTGGEPLLQKDVVILMQSLLNKGYMVGVETSGNLDISHLPAEVVKIMDLKTPASGECDKNNYNNIKHLSSSDEIKFVVMNETDVDWSLEMIHKKNIDKICRVSLSPTDRVLHPMIAKKILESGKAIRQQTQLHKLIWPEKDRGV